MIVVEGANVIADSGNIENDKLKGGKIGVLSIRYIYVNMYRCVFLYVKSLFHISIFSFNIYYLFQKANLEFVGQTWNHAAMTLSAKSCTQVFPPAIKRNMKTFQTRNMANLSSTVIPK